MKLLQTPTHWIFFYPIQVQIDQRQRFSLFLTMICCGIHWLHSIRMQTVYSSISLNKEYRSKMCFVTMTIHLLKFANCVYSAKCYSAMPLLYVPKVERRRMNIPKSKRMTSECNWNLLWLLLTNRYNLCAKRTIHIYTHLSLCKYGLLLHIASAFVPLTKMCANWILLEHSLWVIQSLAITHAPANAHTT